MNQEASKHTTTNTSYNQTSLTQAVSIMTDKNSPSNSGTMCGQPGPSRPAASPNASFASAPDTPTGHYCCVICNDGHVTQNPRCRSAHIEAKNHKQMMSFFQHHKKGTKKRGEKPKPLPASVLEDNGWSCHACRKWVGNSAANANTHLASRGHARAVEMAWGNFQGCAKDVPGLPRNTIPWLEDHFFAPVIERQ